MDEIESIWMDMVVFRIDLMNNWIVRHRSNRYEVDGIGLQAQEAPRESE